MTAAILAGRKTCTSRTRRYGVAGEIVDSPAGELVIIAVQRSKLGHIAEQLYLQEGLSSPERFIALWKGIHPRKRYDPDQLVWLHEFHKHKEPAP